MDTMGWYMRKRSRKRKTPGAFEKLKHLNTHKTQGLEGLPEAFTVDSGKVRKRPLYLTKYFWYPFISVVVALAIAFDLSTHSFSNSVFFGWMVADDDTHELDEYYEEHKAGMDSVFRFIQKRNGKLAGIRLNQEGILLKLRSEDYEEVGKGVNPYFYHRNSTDFHTRYEPEIINGALRVDTYGKHRLYPDFWSYNLEAARLRDINTTIIAHLETSYTELHSILTILAREHYEVNLLKNTPATSLQFHASNYEIIMSDQPDRPGQDPGVQIVAKSRFSDLAKQSGRE
ncbi:MAG: hypothetical protein HEP71_01130 [Roseivirga sp.]|nr:hypothetical protein [Roseivirga sp.]